LKPVKSVNLRLLVNEPNVDIVIAALCTDEAAADKYYTQYKPQFDQTVSQPAMAGFFMNAKMEKKKDTLVISATLNLP